MRFLGIALVMTIGGVCACSGDGDTGSTSQPSNDTGPTQTLYASFPFTLTNTGTADTQFGLHVNGGLFDSTWDMAAAVRHLADAYPSEPTYVKAWRWVRDRHQHYHPVSAAYWVFIPTLYINSEGFGLCSDAASVLYYLWTALGYKSRVWILEGHVVPEVYDGSAWHMLDPDQRVYYMDAKGAIASLEEIEDDPSLITSPLRVVEGATEWAYSQQLADIYTSIDDNHLLEDLPENEPDLSAEFILPPGGSLTFTYAQEPLSVYMSDAPLPPIQGDDPPSYGDIVESLPVGWTGDISTPFVVHDIQGQGRVEITDTTGFAQTFDVPSNKLEGYINSRTTIASPYFYHLRIVGNSGLRILWLLNLKVIAPQSINTIEIYGIYSLAIQPE
jgi:hypothetical protein